MSIRCCSFSDGRPLESLLRIPPLSLSTDWYGAPPDTPFRTFLGAGESTLSLGIEVDGPPFELGGPPRKAAFVEGLWKADVVELFLFGSADEYFEVNLAPSGAWWCARFDSYRMLSRDVWRPDAETWCMKSDTRWAAALRFPRPEADSIVGRWPSFEGNVAAILGGKFFSVAAASGAPDFHRPRAAFVADASAS